MPVVQKLVVELGPPGEVTIVLSAYSGNTVGKPAGRQVEAHIVLSKSNHFFGFRRCKYCACVFVAPAGTICESE